MIEIRPLPPEPGPDELSSVVELRHTLDAELDPADAPAPARRILLDLTAAVPMAEQRTFVAWHRGRAIGLANNWHWYGRRNRGLGESNLAVHPAWRRQGVGTALAAATARAFLDDERTSLLAFGPESAATTSFWRAQGAEIGYREQASRLEVSDVDEALMAEWVARHNQRAGDYDLVRWRGPAPDELRSTHRLARNAMNDAPIGTLEWEKGLDDEEEIEGFSKWVIASGRESWVIAAVDATGAIGGFTSVWVDLIDASRSWQADTGVLPEHRGRGLGRWIKAAMWQWLRAEAPLVTRLTTDNAADNEAMLAINLAMGFVPYRITGGWQPDIHQLAADSPIPTASS